MWIKNALWALATATLLTVASPTTGLSQTTAKAQTSINNCLSTEPLINQMYEKVIKPWCDKKDWQWRIDELCKIMSLAKDSYTKEVIDRLTKTWTKVLEDWSYVDFIALLAILDKNGVTQAGKDSNIKCKQEKIFNDKYIEISKVVDMTILIKAIEEPLKKIQSQNGNK